MLQILWEMYPSNNLTPTAVYTWINHVILPQKHYVKHITVHLQETVPKQICLL